MVFSKQNCYRVQAAASSRKQFFCAPEIFHTREIWDYLFPCRSNCAGEFPAIDDDKTDYFVLWKKNRGKKVSCQRLKKIKRKQIVYSGDLGSPKKKTDGFR